jgi:hypothetical protein
VHQGWGPGMGKSGVWAVSGGRLLGRDDMAWA